MGTKEIWKPVKGYEGLYEVSNLGRVKRLRKNGNHCILKPWNKRRAYVFVTLSKDGKANNVRLHRLVAAYFVPNPENKKQVNHIDCDPSNNAASNLEWCTRAENVKHAVDNRRLGYVSKRVLDFEKAQEIRKLSAAGIPQVEIAEAYNVTRNHVSSIINGRRWTSPKN